MFCCSWGPPSRGSKKPPQPVRGVGGGSKSAAPQAAHSSHHDGQDCYPMVPRFPTSSTFLRFSFCDSRSFTLRVFDSRSCRLQFSSSIPVSSGCGSVRQTNDADFGHVTPHSLPGHTREKFHLVERIFLLEYSRTPTFTGLHSRGRVHDACQLDSNAPTSPSAGFVAVSACFPDANFYATLPLLD